MFKQNFLNLNMQESDQGIVFKAKMQKEHLSEALQAVSAAQQSDNVELSWVQINFLEGGIVTTTASNSTLSIKYETIGKYEGNCCIKLAGKQISEYIRSLPSTEIDIEIEYPVRINIRCGKISKATFQLKQDFAIAEIEIPNVGSLIHIKGEILSMWTDKYKDFTLLDDTRYFALGAYISCIKTENKQELQAVASDSQRLARALIKEELEIIKTDGGSVIVPRKTLDEIKRVANIEAGSLFNIRFDEEILYFSIQTEKYTLISRCISGAYPPWESALPKDENIFMKTNVKQLLESLKRTLIFADKAKTVEFTITKNNLGIGAYVPGQKEDEENVEIESNVEKEQKICLNANYLIGVLNQFTSDHVTFIWDLIEKPVKIIGEVERALDCFYLLVPIKN